MVWTLRGFGGRSSWEGGDAGPVASRVPGTRSIYGDTVDGEVRGARSGHQLHRWERRPSAPQSGQPSFCAAGGPGPSLHSRGGKPAKYSCVLVTSRPGTLYADDLVHLSDRTILTLFAFLRLIVFTRVVTRNLQYSTAVNCNYVARLFEALLYKTGGPRFDSRWGNWAFS